MKITISQRTNGRISAGVFRLEGKLDVHSYQELETRAQEASAEGTEKLILDMTGVTHLDSAGLRAIHFLFNLLRTGDVQENDAALKKSLFLSRHLKLVNPSRMVRQILSTAGFDMFLGIYPTVDEAVESF